MERNVKQNNLMGQFHCTLKVGGLPVTFGCACTNRQVGKRSFAYDHIDGTGCVGVRPCKHLNTSRPLLLVFVSVSGNNAPLLPAAPRAGGGPDGGLPGGDANRRGGGGTGGGEGRFFAYSVTQVSAVRTPRVAVFCKPGNPPVCVCVSVQSRDSRLCRNLSDPVWHWLQSKSEANVDLFFLHTVSVTQVSAAYSWVSPRVLPCCCLLQTSCVCVRSIA